MTDQVLTICYLINYYPKISHTFIRREILALERAGAKVLRISVRHSPEALTDELDRAEERLTHFILDGSKTDLIRHLLTSIISSPSLFICGLRKALSLAKPSGETLKAIIYLVEACKITNLCKQHKVDHLHAHFGTNPTSLAAIIKSLGGPPFSFTIHGPDEFDAPKLISLQEKIADAKFVSAITSFCKSQLFRWAHYKDWSKIKIVHCSIDGKIITEATNPIKQHRRLLNIGRLSEQKGQMLLLESIALVKRQGVDDIQLDIVGDGELRYEMENFISLNKLENNVGILGWKNGDEIQRLLDDTTAMILPSFAEGLPVVIMEALGRARPVITTYIAGIPELVDEQCGFLIRPGDVEQLATTIHQFLETDLDTLNQMGNEGRKRVLHEHNADTEAQKLLAHIQS